MKDSNREAFESWATDKFPIAGLGQFEKHNNGTYLQRSIRNMYEAWQAAKAHEAKKLDGCVVVPVEPTPKMIDSTWDDQDEIDTMSHNTRNEFIYKKMIEVAMAESARGGNDIN